MKNLVYSEFSDEQLISQFLKGDNHSVGILYGRYYQKVYAKCYSFSGNGDDAFDMAQEVLLKTICSIESFGGNSKFSTWLYSITKNYCITQSGRKSRRYQEDIKLAHQILEDKMDEEDLEKRLRWEELELNLDKYLKLLSEEERQLLDLKYRKNYSVKELQQEFDLSASAVKMRLLRARLKMSQIIAVQEAA